MNLSHKTTQRILSVTVAFAFGVFAALGLAGAVRADESTPLTVALDWVPNPDHAGLYYADQKGMFTGHNLSVFFQVPSNPADPIKLVGLKKVDLAITYEPEMFYAQQEGVPVTSVATVIPVPLNALILSPDVGVKTIADMKGHSVGVPGIPVSDGIYATMLKTAGLTESQVKKINVGWNLLPMLLSGQVDSLIGGYRNVEAIQYDMESGKKSIVFSADELGVPSYAELVVAANPDRLKADPAYAAAVREFVAALVEGTDGARNDPAGATEIMKGVTEYDAAFLDKSVPYTLELMTPPKGQKTGCMSQSDWQDLGNWMKDSGLITITPDASKLMTNDYLPYAC